MRVLVVDDDKLVAVSLKTILEADGEITVVGLGEAGDDAIRLYREQHPDILLIELYRKYEPDVLLMDIRMQGMSGLDAAECILKEDQAAKILFLTTFSDDEYIVKALNMGAKGYLLKQDFESIVPALKAVYGEQSVFGGQIMGKIPVLLAGKGSFSYHDYDISEKEQGIIELVAEGLSNREIAEKLYLSEGTVRNYISTILDKLKLRDRTQLAVFYYKNCG